MNAKLFVGSAFLLASILATVACGSANSGSDDDTSSSTSDLAASCMPEQVAGPVFVQHFAAAPCSQDPGHECTVTHRIQPVEKQCTNSTTGATCFLKWSEYYKCEIYPEPAQNSAIFFPCVWYANSAVTNDGC